MSAGDTTLDHVGLVGRDLAAMHAAMRRLGFAPTEPKPLMGVDRATGARVPLDQSSSHIVLERGYVELSAVHTDSPTHHLAAYISRFPGLHILAFGTDDVTAARARCRDAGLLATAPAAAAREIAYGRLRGTARFEWFMLEPSAAPEGLVCFARNLTPELVYQPEVQRHGNGARSLEAVYVVSQDRRGTARRLADATGGVVAEDGAGACVEVVGGRVHVLDPAGFEARFDGVSLPALPCLAGMTLGVADPGATASCLAGNGIVANRRSDGTLWVGPQLAAGTVIEFTA
jgi:hypothetical protein